LTEPNQAGSGLREVPLSALEHYDYCHRQAALIHVEGVWSQSAETVRGDLSHTAVDLPGIQRRRGRTIIRSLPVWSHTHGLRGICDVVAGQALCLIEAGFQVPTGHIYSVTERRRHPVPIDAAILERVVSATAAVRQLLTNATLPTARNDARCRKCSLREDCLPELTDGRRQATRDLFTPRPFGQWRD